MVSETIPVYVYTAVNGYAWQGCDRLTADFLQKALKATGVLNRNDVWGGIIRRPIASPAWPEWPKSRMCTILYRFLRSSARDQMGRESSYIAAACLPFREQEDGIVNFRRILNSSVMRYAQKEGFDKLGLELDESWLIPDVEEEGLLQDLDWRESWAEPRLFSGRTCLEQLSRLFHNPGSSLGDLKAVVRTPDEGATGLTASATYAVFPQISAVLAAESAFGEVPPDDLERASRAMSDWQKRLSEVRQLGTVLGSGGIKAFVGERDEQASSRRNELEKRKEKAHKFEEAVATVEKMLNGFQMSLEPKEDEKKRDNLRFRIEKLEEDLNKCDDPAIRKSALPKAETCRTRFDELFQNVNKIREYWNEIRTFADNVMKSKEDVSHHSFDQHRGKKDKAEKIAGQEHFAKDVIDKMGELLSDVESTLRDREEGERRKKNDKKELAPLPRKTVPPWEGASRSWQTFPPSRAEIKDPVWPVVLLALLIVAALGVVVLVVLGVLPPKRKPSSGDFWRLQSESPSVGVETTTTETDKSRWYHFLMFWRGDSNSEEDPSGEDRGKTEPTMSAETPRKDDGPASRGDKLEVVQAGTDSSQSTAAAADKNSLNPSPETSDSAPSADDESLNPSPETSEPEPAGGRKSSKRSAGAAGAKTEKDAASKPAAKESR